MEKGTPSKTPAPAYGGPRSYATVLRRIREALQLTQEEMSTRVGKSSAAYRSYERAVFNPPEDVRGRVEGMARAAGLVDMADALSGANPIDRAYLEQTSLGEAEHATFARFLETVPAEVAAAMLTTMRALTDRYAPDGEGEGEG